MAEVLVGVVLGFLLANLQRWFYRRRHIAAYWKALREDIQYCHKGALAIEVKSPLGRLPTMIFDEVIKRFAVYRVRA